ncbi:isochorismatase family protein [uncultured Leifsonia sp.]|uniref:isochorismatase family protein n=1 Tax=uncultured Leifsonia sp. TaxID=340359 RepID=UPI0025FB8C06|nr:isochorismatase family protein [uncultured Leifsonia sp.]
MERMGYGLILVDVQRNMLEGQGAVVGAAGFRALLSGLLDAARDADAAIIHVKNDGRSGDPDEPGTDGWELEFTPLPGEPVVRKNAANTFESNPALADVLRAMGVDTVVVAGLQSELCVQATALGALERGFDVIVPAGAHTTYDDVEPAAVVVERVTLELIAAGVEVPELDEVSFG